MAYILLAMMEKINFAYFRVVNHIIFYLENFSDSFQLLELYAREPDTSPELKNEFVEICQKYGIVKENVIDLTKVDRCFQARGNGVA
ncbi:major allergen Equ c 1-like [Capricornis sumatraensis]|uniref:major allergen Equ c 1-like n=1 Tax=Capricornis sumatraensis TaxID=34865 RepID=UPI003604D3EC